MARHRAPRGRGRRSHPPKAFWGTPRSGGAGDKTSPTSQGRARTGQLASRPGQRGGPCGRKVRRHPVLGVCAGRAGRWERRVPMPEEMVLPPLPPAPAPAPVLARYNLDVPSLWLHEGPAAGERDREPQGPMGPLRKVRTPQGRPLGASREGATPGKCHREQTASGPGFRVRARVKRWGKSPPPGPRGSRARQTPAGARPNREALEGGPPDASG